ncbi:branched-chain amino acid ABC transporter permease [Microvirga soli]|uniref:branched-chain amino acid ABC transporter permease n=1 Tax=Microvirga soli TaxID=1854496 RepID=UPI00191F2D54|nr:branched-chain amino acid ABC transporter permease [Microvirga soli]
MVRITTLALLLAAVPLFVQSNHLLGLFIAVLFSAYLAQSWNILGGLCGQFSFGHAAFFGVGLYSSLILQVDFGWPAPLALVSAAVAGAVTGLFVGFVSFRYGLRGSYFALVTLAFAEILRMTASVVSFTGAGSGKYLPTRLGIEHLQFSKSGYFYFILVLFVLVHLLVLAIQNSRLGARFAAIREDEEAASALGVDVFRYKMIAILISSAVAGVGGCFYGQYYFYTDPHIAFGAAVSIEMLLAPIIGGAGTLFGPIVGAVVLRVAAELGQSLTGGVPGFNLILYGIMVILIVRYMPDGLIGGLRRPWALMRRRPTATAG